MAAISALVTACGPGEAAVDDPSVEDLQLGESSLTSYPGLTEGSRDAIGVLKLANEGSLVQLTASAAVGLQARTANSIIAGRPLTTLSQLLGTKYVGTASMRRLLDYARAHGYVPPAPPQDDPMPTCDGAPLMPTTGNLVFTTGTQTSFGRSCDAFGVCSPWKQAGYALSVHQNNGSNSLILTPSGGVYVQATIGPGYTIEGGGTYYCENYDIGSGNINPVSGYGTGQMRDGYRCNISGGSGGPGGPNDYRPVAMKYGATCLAITDQPSGPNYGAQHKRVIVLRY